MSSIQEYSPQSLLNIELLPPSRRSELKLSKWRMCSVYIHSVSKILNLESKLLMNALMLYSDYITLKAGDARNYQLYSDVCLAISAAPLHAYLSLQDYMNITEADYTQEEFIKGRSKIITHRNGRTRFLTVVDLIEQRGVPEEDTIIAILCCLWHPTFTTIKSDILAEACRFSNFSLTIKVDEKDTLIRDIIGTLQEFHNHIPKIELPERYQVILEHFSQLPPITSSMERVLNTHYSTMYYTKKIRRSVSSRKWYYWRCETSFQPCKFIRS